jgi:hypothetical protein|tara:strand:+ start:231 stop:665 length:435 start_codon:yes stop_codon:yes gene_type:complete
MSFDTLQDNYRSKMNNGQFFETTDECAEFIVDEYHNTITSGGGAYNMQTGNKDLILTPMKAGLQSQSVSVLLDGVGAGLVLYWTALTNGVFVTAGGTPPTSTWESNTLDGFLNNMGNYFKEHLDTVIFTNTSSGATFSGVYTVT